MTMYDTSYLRTLAKRSIVVPYLYRMVKHILALPYLMLAIPSVLLLRCIKPIVIIRIAQIDFTIAFGHSWAIQPYLCERDAGLQEKKGIVDIFYTILTPKNKWFFAKCQEHIRIFTNSKLLEMIDRVNRWIPGYQDHVIFIRTPNELDFVTSDVDHQHIMLGRKPVDLTYRLCGARKLIIEGKTHITFNDTEDNLGKQELEKMGISKTTKYICFHTRDAAYKKLIVPGRDWSYHDFRDANIQNYIPMAERLALKGYYMVRVGAEVAEALNTANPMIIDCPLKYRTEFLDFYLGANCYFFITSNTGAVMIPGIFRKPIVLVNLVPMDSPPSWTEHDLAIPKKLWLKREKRFLTFREIFESKLYRTHHSQKYANLGIEIVENSPEEISEAAIEMERRLSGKWKTSEEELELQRRFRYTQENCVHGNVMPLRIGYEFLKENLNLLE